MVLKPEGEVVGVVFIHAVRGTTVVGAEHDDCVVQHSSPRQGAGDVPN